MSSQRTDPVGSPQHGVGWLGTGCPICASRTLWPFLEISEIPVDVGYLWPTREEALRVPRGDIHLALCESCGYIGNHAFNAGKVTYAAGYDASLHHSPFYQAFVDSLASRLVEQYDLRGRTVVEIACGNGDFLRLLCRLGGNTGVGFDPSTRPEDVRALAEDGITVVRDYYSEAYADVRGDFICCRHVLSSLADPVALVSTVRRAIGNRAGAVVYFEVPSVRNILDNLAIWSFMYEHCSYFGEESLARLLTVAGFHVLRVAPCFEGQYVAIEAIPELRAGEPKPVDASESAAPVVAAVRDFSDRYQAKVSGWRDQLWQLRKSGRRTVAWGAGGRAITFLNVLKVDEEVVPYVVDINPERQGAFLPGTAQQVVPPEALLEYAPDTVIITNPTFAREIQNQVEQLGLSCDFLLA